MTEDCLFLFREEFMRIQNYLQDESVSIALRNTVGAPDCEKGAVIVTVS